MAKQGKLWPAGFNKIQSNKVDNFMVSDKDTKEIGYIDRNELVNSIEITGELLDPIAPGTAQSPAVIPAGPAGQKRKFTPAPGFYRSAGVTFQELVSTNRWEFYWNGTAWQLIDLGLLPTEDLTEIESNINTVNETNSSVGRIVEIESDNLTQGRAINFKHLATNPAANIDFILFRADNTFITVGKSALTESAYVLPENFKRYRFYNNNDADGFTATVNFLGIWAGANLSNDKLNANVLNTDKIDTFFKSSSKITRPITWKNNGGYWSTAGVFVSNASYDISDPIGVSGWNYYGFYGELNQGVMSIVAVNSAGLLESVVQVGLLPFGNNGLSLYVFKTQATFISVSTLNSRKPSVELFQLKSPMLIRFLDNIDATTSNTSNITNLTTDFVDNISGINLTGSVASGRAVNMVTPYLKRGKLLEYGYTGNVDNANISVFLYRADGTYVQAPAATRARKKYRLLEDFVRVYFYNNTNTTGFSISISIGAYQKMYLNNLMPASGLRVLVLGDSYSQTGANGVLSAWIRPFMDSLPLGSTVFSVAVSSATIRDKFGDRATYPYTSRPVSTSAASSNLNTLGCQIEKLKRLMAGVDLDAGETKIYATSAEHPNVIIIEGGMNDTYDSEAVQATYFGQFTKVVSAYHKTNSASSASVGNVAIKTPMSEVDRTSFAGAYRYLIEELLSIFPNTQIFFTTASRLGYWTYDVNERRSKTSAQQRICAELCGASVIDWNKEGQINTILNYPTGSGTQADPYITDRTVGNVDTNDAMHPNERGGKKYGRLAARVVMERFLNIGDE